MTNWAIQGFGSLGAWWSLPEAPDETGGANQTMPASPPPAVPPSLPPAVIFGSASPPPTPSAYGPMQGAILENITAADRAALQDPSFWLSYSNIFHDNWSLYTSADVTAQMDYAAWQTSVARQVGIDFAAYAEIVSINRDIWAREAMSGGELGAAGGSYFFSLEPSTRVSSPGSGSGHTYEINGTPVDRIMAAINQDANASASDPSAAERRARANDAIADLQRMGFDIRRSSAGGVVYDAENPDGLQQSFWFLTSGPPFQGGGGTFGGGGASGSWGDPPPTNPGGLQQITPQALARYALAELLAQQRETVAVPGIGVPTPGGERETAGIQFTTDGLGRTVQVKGELGLTHSERNRQLQLAAGGPDRLDSDEGGHFIGARFGGPGVAQNLFPQDSNFNRSAYRALENQWARALAQGQTVSVMIDVRYPNAQSQRPAALVVTYSINGQPPVSQVFSNRSSGT